MTATRCNTGSDKYRHGRQRFMVPLLVLMAALLFQLCMSFGSNTDPGAAYGHGEDYYFPWYDSLYGQTWILMTEPSGGSTNIFDVFFHPYDQPSMVQMNTSGPISVPQGQTGVIIEPGSMGGPVYIESQHQGLVSERSLFGNSFEEVWATHYDDLDSHYWWPLYDGYSPGMQNWIMVSNPPGHGESINAKVTIHIPPGYGNDVVSYSDQPIPPGATWIWEFPGLISGPVEARTWRTGGNENSPFDARKSIASQRVLYNGAFNEFPGIPDSDKSDAYVWPWYDSVSPGADNWILVANPDPNETIYAAVGIGLDDSGGGGVGPEDFVEIPPQMTATFWDGTMMDGPVLAVGCYDPYNWYDTPAPTIASQRLIWGNSFSEIAGSSEADTSHSNTNWTWYDQQSPGAANWVMLSNLNDFDVYVEIRIGGNLHWQGNIEKYRIKTPAFPGVMGGPVEVNAWTNSAKTTPAPVFASQRVLWNGYFNEIVGKGL